MNILVVLQVSDMIGRLPSLWDTDSILYMLRNAPCICIPALISSVCFKTSKICVGSTTHYGYGCNSFVIQ